MIKKPSFISYFIDVRSYPSLSLFILLHLMSFLETNKAQLNQSRSKQLYSFNKSSRFTNGNYVSPAPYYDNKVTSLGKRATSFGYGQKFTLENKSGFPSPDCYKKGGSF